MMRVQKLAAELMAVLMLGALIACAPIFKIHGYVPEDHELDRLIVGTDTRDSVAQLVGRPSTAALLNDDGWYYVQSRWKQVGPAAPVEIDRQVVAITFNEAGTVQNVEKFGLEKGNVVALSRRVTEVNVASAGFLKQLFGNVGGIGAGQLLDGAP